MRSYPFMKPIQRILAGMALAAVSLVGLAGQARAQQVLATPLQIDQNQLLYHTNKVGTNATVGINWQSMNGVPISSVFGNGSDGLAPTLLEQESQSLTTAPATTNQYATFVSISGIPAQSSTAIDTGASFSANATAMNWPRATSDGTPNGKVTLILR